MHLSFLVLIRDLEDDYYALFRKLRCGGRDSDIQNGKMYRRQNTYWMDQDIKEGIEVQPRAAMSSMPLRGSCRPR